MGSVNPATNNTSSFLLNFLCSLSPVPSHLLSLIQARSQI